MVENHGTILLLDLEHCLAKRTHELWTTISNVGSDNSKRTPDILSCHV